MANVDQGPVVSISRTREKHRSIARIEPLVKACLDPLGGIERFVKPGHTVLIKPNQTVYYAAEEGCTTDPLVVAALIRLAKRAGATKVQVGESSGGYFSSLDCMRITGMAAAAEREGAELIDLGSDQVTNRIVPIPNGKVIKDAPIPAPLLDADVVISVPKAKTHHIEPISGALKSWVGAVNQGWRLYNHGDRDMIQRFVEIMSVSKPDLIVADALICGEGDGPIANLPHWCGAIVASTDPVAIDVTLARLMSVDDQPLRFAEAAEAFGLGSRGPITYVGVPLEDVRIEAWHGHKGFDYLPINMLVGEGVTLEGTIGHVKSVLDSMLRRGELRDVVWLKGTPTVMIGAIDDPDFERHLEEGPYVVFDDAAKPEYKNDPRVHFVPGHPVLRTAMPELMKGLGVSIPGKASMKLQQFRDWGEHSLSYGSTSRKVKTLAKPVVFALASIAGIVLAFRGVSRLLKAAPGA